MSSNLSLTATPSNEPSASDSCYFGQKYSLVEIWLAKCRDASIFALAAKYHIKTHDVVYSSVTLIKEIFGFIF